MERGDYEFNGIGVGLFADVERIPARPVNQAEPLAHVLQSDAGLVRLTGTGMTAVDDLPGNLVVSIPDGQMDERPAIITYAVLECVLDEDDEQQRRNGDLLGQIAGRVDADVDGVGIADAHQSDIILQELDVAVERNPLAARIVKYITHHLRKLDHGALGILGIDVDQRVDVVERIHEEMRVDLVLEVIHFGLQVLLFQLLHLLLITDRLVHELDPRIGPGHEERQHDVPIHLQIGKRHVAQGMGRLLDRYLHDKPVAQEIDGREDSKNEQNIACQIHPVLVPQHEPRSEHRIMDDEDDQVRRHTLPRSTCNSDIICELSTGTRMMADHTMT